MIGGAGEMESATNGAALMQKVRNGKGNRKTCGIGLAYAALMPGTDVVEARRLAKV